MLIQFALSGNYRQRLRSLDYRVDFKLATSCNKEINSSSCGASEINDVISLSKLLLCLETFKDEKKQDFSSACLLQLNFVRKQLVEDYSVGCFSHLVLPEMPLVDAGDPTVLPRPDGPILRRVQARSSRSCSPLSHGSAETPEAQGARGMHKGSA